MRTVVAVALGLLVGAAVVITVILTLSDEESPSAAASSRRSVTTADCVEIIPDAVFETLGWSAGAASTEHAGRCEKHGDDGNITVGDLAVTATDDERSEAAEQVYEDRCFGLFGEAGATPDLGVDWLPEGTTACARLLPAGQDVGLAELFLLTDEHEVVQIRLAALTATPQAQVQEGLAELVAAADGHW